MNPMLMTTMMVLAVLASCSRSGSGSPASGLSSSAVGTPHKVEGPPIDRLSADQISRIAQTCFLYHDLEDQRLPYTSRYCEKVDQERNRRAMLTPGKRSVIVGGQAVQQVQ
jgi:hypothetical protein